MLNNSTGFFRVLTASKLLFPIDLLHRRYNSIHSTCDSATTVLIFLTTTQHMFVSLQQVFVYVLSLCSCTQWQAQLMRAVQLCDVLSVTKPANLAWPQPATRSTSYMRDISPTWRQLLNLCNKQMWCVTTELLWPMHYQLGVMNWLQQVP